ncbi:Non-canonical poly(A) RNA polymerase papd5, partial [Borealophlyctis nickersoniae]
MTSIPQNPPQQTPQQQQAKQPPEQHSPRVARLQALTAQAAEFAAKLTPRPEEQAVRTHIIQRFSNLVTQALALVDPLAEPTLEVVGSMSSGVYLPGGDIDLVVLYPSERGASDVLTVLYEALQTVSPTDGPTPPFADPTTIKLIMTARVPVLKFRTCMGNVAVDVTCNASSGIASTRLVKTWMTTYPTTLRPLVLLVKRWLSERKFDEVYTGGLGGYAVANMCLAIVLGARGRRMGKDVELGMLVMEFFEAFGMTLDYTRKGVSVRIGKFVDRPAGLVNRVRYAPVGATSGSTLDFGLSLYVEDPADPTNDICRASYRVAEIREAMAETFVRLEDGIDGMFGEDVDLLAGIVSLDAEEEKRRDEVCGEWQRFVAGEQQAAEAVAAVSNDPPAAAAGGMASVVGMVEEKTSGESTTTTTTTTTSRISRDDKFLITRGKRVREGRESLEHTPEHQHHHDNDTPKRSERVERAERPIYRPPKERKRSIDHETQTDAGGSSQQHQQPRRRPARRREDDVGSCFRIVGAARMAGGQ